MRRTSLAGVVLMLLVAVVLPVADASEMLTLQTRSRIESPEDSGEHQVVYKTVEWDPRQTAIIICDMWQRHWCDGAVGRCNEMAPRVNEFIKAARDRGVLIVHAPSGGMKHYEDHPARRRARAVPKAANLPEGIAGGCSRIEAEKKGTWPIDQSDGGCDCQPRCPGRPMDVHQTDAITIRNEDAISDSGVECWNLFGQRGVKNVILTSVHTNMCVIGRPFGLRNMVRFGKNVLLVRDLTDTMYNPRKAPFVRHVRGTELIVEHIEKYVCPTVTSSSLLGGPATRLKEDRRPHVAIIVSDDHYDADRTLPLFADELRGRYDCYCTVIHGEGTGHFPAFEELKATDVAVLFVRRLALPKQQVDLLREYLDAGRPLVALRTASHAFDVRGESPAGFDQWPEFDAEVLGGNYHGHEADELGTDVAIVPDRSDHPLLSGVKPARWHSTGSLYRTSPIAADATLLMTGSISGKSEPLTWTRQYKRARVFYTSLGHPDDFKQPAFRRLLANAIFWAMEKPTPKVGAIDTSRASPRETMTNVSCWQGVRFLQVHRE